MNIKIAVTVWLAVATTVAVGGIPVAAAQPMLAGAPPVVPIVSHAGEVVTFRPPAGWQVWEMPTRREIRVRVTPTDTTGRRMRDGVWLAFHHPSVSDPAQSMAVRMDRRLRQHLSEPVAAEKRVSIQLREAKGLQQEFTVASVGGPLRGVHIMADTPWGALEVFAVAPTSKYQERKPSFQSLLQSIRFAPPKKRPGALPEFKSLQPLLGSWKAFRSRVHFYRDGKMVIVSDQPTQLTRPNASVPQKLSGVVKAEKDLLYVTWEDGSRLNIRWRRHGQRLLLTDHNGKTVLLQPLVH